MEYFIATFGYWAILVGTFLEGETILVLGGFSAHRGWLDLPMVMLAAFAGSSLGDLLYFHIGRKKGQSFLDRRPGWRARTAKVTELVRRHQLLVILTSRFLYGLRTVIPFALGAAGVSPSRFLVLNLVGAAVWAVAFGAGGWYLGEALQHFLHDLARYESVAVLGIACVGAAIWIVNRRLRAARRAKPTE
ncbi:MAG: DedA family protein [Planctomycetes bacterium]|nr:DedA family protein [Planctomycetota bacterium]